MVAMAALSPANLASKLSLIILRNLSLRSLSARADIRLRAPAGIPPEWKHDEFLNKCHLHLDELGTISVLVSSCQRRLIMLIQPRCSRLNEHLGNWLGNPIESNCELVFEGWQAVKIE